ncbi:dipeptide/oligopeptide/nickel ABC transporter permease/ATP-binding protein [Micrococcus luteus]|uniref:dipeptide/oligopeptide/nickel ABC transporter permease/ATP-binding protein n=1 Tax=Micrococcus luteus TaxID=1270 RepID=UPI003F7DC666
MPRTRLTRRLEAGAGRPFPALPSLPVSTLIALLVLALLVGAAVLAPVLLPAGPYDTGPAVRPPGAEHWFGTDAQGRDLFTRVMYGARSSLVIGVLATAAALAVAAVIGSIAATASRPVSEVIMRVLDVVMSFPGIALVAAFVAVWGNGVWVIIFAIAFIYTPQLARVVRANVLSQFGEDYVLASRVMGAGTAWILVRHVARNTLAPILVFACILVADAIVLEASLSFINAGIRPPEPSWGNILADGKQLLLSGYWWQTFFPGLMILLTVLGLNVVAEGLTDALASPRARPVAVVAEAAATTDQVDDAEAAARHEDAVPAERLEDEAVAAARPAALGETDEAARAAALTASLERLRVAERERSDRLVRPADAPQEPVLEVKDLSIAFPDAHGDVDIVDRVSFSVHPGETMGLVGESGCGKSITAMSIMGLLPPTARIGGEIRFEGRDLLTLGPRERNALRGPGMAMVYQDALSSLNPSMLVSAQLQQLLRRGGTRSAAELLELVGLDPRRTLKSYPHELSGGQRQRVLIAMALTRDPRLLIADEPTTALDVTVQQQVVELLDELRRELGFAMVFVSHDLALVARLAHRITVMYAGQVVEQGDTSDLLADPRHEYTRGLLGAVLSIESGARRLHQVRGTVPSPREFAAGDRFAPRSEFAGVGADARLLRRTVAGTTHHYATTEELEIVRAAAREGERR